MAPNHWIVQFRHWVALVGQYFSHLWLTEEQSNGSLMAFSCRSIKKSFWNVNLQYFGSRAILASFEHFFFFFFLSNYYYWREWIYFKSIHCHLVVKENKQMPQKCLIFFFNSRNCYGLCIIPKYLWSYFYFKKLNNHSYWWICFLLMHDACN